MQTVKLDSTRLFYNLSVDELRQVSKFVSIQHYRRGDFLFHAGDHADAICFLLKGIVKVSYVNPGGDEKIISIFQSGDIFGELFLGKYRHRIGTSRALENSIVGKLTESNLLTLVGCFPEIGLNLIRHLADEQRETLARLHALMHVDARHRLLGTLLSLVRRYCCEEDGWFRLPECITQEDIASIACLHRSTANILINDLRRQSVLGGNGRLVTVNQEAVEKLLREAGLEILE